ncbi:hypothetical protein NEOLEDRAFT_1152519 [Neolentinus lepideus HHB14362 ss-1]|uniref:Uncharacterized protein n=1 Tax=Neolentinus lepideus HHB14362 ss-1 TaxID=1314782 RepID=A0A165MP88_9AGAM|nr:hypothetical protein NEOLEDRAFT_1152519 [Neolentinus lepideus HHB14362 ss-1]
MLMGLNRVITLLIVALVDLWSVLPVRAAVPDVLTSCHQLMQQHHVLYDISSSIDIIEPIKAIPLQRASVRDSERAYSGGQLHGGKVAVVVGVGEEDDSPASVTRRSMNTDTRLAVMVMDVIVVHGHGMSLDAYSTGTISAAVSLSLLMTVTTAPRSSTAHACGLDSDPSTEVTIPARYHSASMSRDHNRSQTISSPVRKPRCSVNDSHFSLDELVRGSSLPATRYSRLLWSLDGFPAQGGLALSERGWIIERTWACGCTNCDPPFAVASAGGFRSRWVLDSLRLPRLMITTHFAIRVVPLPSFRVVSSFRVASSLVSRGEPTELHHDPRSGIVQHRCSELSSKTPSKRAPALVPRLAFLHKQADVRKPSESAR